MAQRLVEFPLQDGGSVLMHVDDPPAANGGVTRAWRDGDLRVLEQSALSFERAVAKCSLPSRVSSRELVPPATSRFP
jgi:hypothetical protein